MSSKKLVLRIAPKAVVCQEATLVGDITVGEGSVVHPKVTIIAEAGPIIIGKNNIFEEQVIIKNTYSENASEEEKKKPKTMTIGNDNIFEVGCQIESASIGNFVTLESRAQVQEGSSIMDGCVVGGMQVVFPKQIVPENTIIWGSKGEQLVQPRARDQHIANHSKHLEILCKTLPSFHHLMKSTE